MRPKNAKQLAAWADVPDDLAKITVSGAKRYGLPLCAIRGDCRKRNLVVCRWYIAGRARKAGFSFPQIGRALNRDHSTIVYALGRLAA